jgi:hypothetical protein
MLYCVRVVETQRGHVWQNLPSVKHPDSSLCNEKSGTSTTGSGDSILQSKLPLFCRVPYADSLTKRVEIRRSHALY